MGGKAELMGDTCTPVMFPPPLPPSASTVTEVERFEDTVGGLGVAGVFAVGTLPMNHDCKCGEDSPSVLVKEEHTGTQPRSPVSSLTACGERIFRDRTQISSFIDPHKTSGYIS